MRLFNRIILRRLLHERLRTGVTVLGIAVGIAVIAAIRMANATAVIGFASALEAISGRTSLEIVAPGVPLDELKLESLPWLRQYGELSPVIEGDALAQPSDGRRELMRVLGVDILREQPFRTYHLLTFEHGRQPRAEEFLRLLIDPDAIILTEAFAKRHQLTVGSTIPLVIGDRRLTFVVRALLADEGPARALDGNFALLDIAAAQLAFDRLGRLDRLDLRLFDDRSVDGAEAAIARRLPPGLFVQRPERRGRQVEQMLAAFHFNLTALSYIALLVGLFLVYNTISIAVISRREEIGTLRALGVTKRQVLWLFLGEALILATLGCVLGLPLARLLAEGAVQLTTTTVNSLYVPVAPARPTLSLADVLLAFGIGIPLSLLAAALPALEASGVPPTAAIRGADRVERRYRIRLRDPLVACVLFGLGWWLSTLEPLNGLPVFGFASAVSVVFGAVFLVPVVLDLVARFGGGPLTRVFGIEGRLAHANLASAIPRIAISVAALATSLSMLTAIAIMIGSFRETVVYWVDQTLRADLYVSPGRRGASGTQVTLSPEVEQAARGLPGVVAVDRFNRLDVPYDDSVIAIGAGDFEVLLQHGNLLFKAPQDPEPAVRASVDRHGLVVSESFTLKHRKGVGDSVTIPTPSGPVTFRVAAVYYDYSSDRGIAVMDRRTFVRYFGETSPGSLVVYLAPGADADAARQRLLAAVGDRHAIFVNTNAALRREILRIFDATFAITYALEAIAIFVAILGAAGTLLTLILERGTDLSILRLIGAGRAQIRRMVVIEAALIGAVSQAIGIAVGLVLSLLLIYVVNVQSFGWTIQFHLPVRFLVQSSVLILVATMLSGLYPAARAAQATLVTHDE